MRQRLLAATLLAVLSACALPGGQRTPSTIYAPDPRVAADPSWPEVNWQLSLAHPTAARMIDGYRIAVRPIPNELQVYRGASWAKTPGDMLQDAILRTLEDSGRLPAVARQGVGFVADYRLFLDLRRFESDYAGRAVPAAVIEVSAKLVHGPDQEIVASRTFLHAEPATSPDVPQVVEAFSRSLGAIARDVSGWVLENGETHERTAHSRARASSP